MRRVVSLFLPSWPTDRLHRSAQPDDARPLLTAAAQGGRRVVMAVDAQAAQLGLRPGMDVAHAQALVEDLRILPADPQGDAAALARLAGWCLRFTPLAAPDPPDGVWLDITGCGHLFANRGEDGEQALLAQLTGALHQSGITARTAAAATPGAAHALARYQPEAASPPLLGGARVGLDETKITPLPVAALRLPEQTVQALHRLGFDTIGQLIKTPRAPLAKRFGPLVLRRLDQALGHAPEPIEPVQPAEMPRSRQGFPEPISTASDIARAIALLCESLCARLHKSGLGANRLDLILRRVDGATASIRIGTAAATRDAAHLARLLCTHIETIDPGFGIEHMTLQASLTSRLEARQSLSELCAERAVDFAPLIDTLQNHLGASNVFRIAPVESDVPERSLRRVAALAAPAGADWPASLPRPPLLYTPPHKVQVIALLPDHAPVQFTWRGQRHRVRHADGPERIFGEWWRSEEETSAVRDYFQVEDESGQRFWLFRRGPEQLDWFLHGCFS